jgi:NAD(P)-dependent dehydrogenase (short-subunit alcohol dehydrogenase family)
MNIDLSGKTAVVTGSTGGNGLAIARGLADCGTTVVVNGRTRTAVDRAVAAVKAMKGPMRHDTTIELITQLNEMIKDVDGHERTKPASSDKKSDHESNDC